LLQEPQVVLRYRGAAQAAALYDFPQRWRVGVAGGEVLDKRQNLRLPLLQWEFPSDRGFPRSAGAVNPFDALNGQARAPADFRQGQALLEQAGKRMTG
jgi:hypothetical protein